MLSAIYAQQLFNLTHPPLPSEDLTRGLGPRAISHNRRWSSPYLLATNYFPNPNTPDNHIGYNIFGIGPIAPVTQENPEVSSSRNLVPGSSRLLKRVAWPPEFRCTHENGSVGPPLLSIALAEY